MTNQVGYRITLREWVSAALVALALTILLQVPYALGYATARAGTEYTGLLVNLSDVTYYSGIQLGMQGEWLYHIRFTGESHDPALLYTFYIALGHLARWLSLDAVAMWHLARAVMSFLMFLVIFGFICYFVEHPTWRRVAYALTILVAGFDWLWLPGEMPHLLSAVPLDVRMPESHIFFSAFTYPHFSAAIALILIMFWCALRGLTDTLGQRIWLAVVVAGALANLGIVFVYPFLVFLTAGILGMYYLWLVYRARHILWREALLLVLLFVPALPLLIYYQRVLATSEIIRLWNEQVTTLSPNVIHYLLTYAPLLVLALWNLARVRFGKDEHAHRRAFLWIWVGVVALLLYAPLNAQRRFVEGVQVPLAILATFGLYENALPRLVAAQWFQKLAQRPGYSIVGLQRLLVVLFIGITTLSSVYLFASALWTTTIQQPYPLFREHSELEAMDWLKRHARPDDVVLGTYYTGSLIPVRAGTRAFIGHQYETAHFLDKWAEVETFFNVTTSDEQRTRLLRSNNIAYVFVGHDEQRVGSFDPDAVPYLNRVFMNKDARIYHFASP